MNKYKQVYDGYTFHKSYDFNHELEYCMDFGLLGFNDWTDLNDEGLTWGAQYDTKRGAILIFLYLDSSYGIHYAEDYVPNDEIFSTDDMSELWSVVRSNLNYFDQLLTKERGVK